MLSDYASATTTVQLLGYDQRFHQTDISALLWLVGSCNSDHLVG